MSSEPSEGCDQCKKLDFRQATLDYYENRASAREASWDYTLFIPDVGGAYQKRPTTDCELCSMLFASRISSEALVRDFPDDLETSGHGSDIDALLCIPYASAELILKYGWKYLPGFTRSLRLVVAPANIGRSVALDVVSRTADTGTTRHGCPVLLLDGPGQNYSALQRLQPKWDVDIARGWLSLCMLQHDKTCGYSGDRVKNMRVIDCRTKMVVALDERPYVALSYVWGQRRSGGDEKARGAHDIEPALAVVTDAMTVTLALGYEYLWVDQHCIDQNNGAAKLDQIRQMDAIYQGADFTIIASAGDSSVGLHGVGNTQRPLQPCITRSDATVIWHEDARQSIRDSIWSTRGWTYQEEVLSRRRLVFTPQQSYFQCKKMHCTEDTIPKTHPFLHGNDVEAQSVVAAGVLSDAFPLEVGHPTIDDGRLEDIRHYYSQVATYTSRRLTFPEDSLNAFLGVVRHFLKQRLWCKHICGLLVFDPPGGLSSSFSLTWEHEDSAWYGSEAPRRRSSLPSWTWAGWQGTIIFPETNSKDWDSVLVFEIQDSQDDSWRDLGNQQDFHRSLPESPTRIRLTACTLKPEHLTLADADDEHWPFRVAGAWEADSSLSLGASSPADWHQQVTGSADWRILYLGTSWPTSVFLIIKSVDDHVWMRARVLRVKLGLMDRGEGTEGPLRTFLEDAVPYVLV